MKLIQKQFLKKSYEFELTENAITISSGSILKRKRSTLTLDSLDPYPYINKSDNLLTFNRIDQSGPAFSLALNQPAANQFESFVNMLSEYIMRQHKGTEADEIKAYSQRLMPPFSGLVQIAESERGRALTMDGKTWELQLKHIMLASEGSADKQFRRRHSHVLTVNQAGLQDIVKRADSANFKLDRSLVEIARFLLDAKFPFPSTDIYEYWLLDKTDDSPLALIFSCSEEAQMETFPLKNEWTALPSAAMPVELNDDEKARQERPVNIRVEQMVAERAGALKAKARWFKRSADESENFPPFLLREDWQTPEQADLCQRYLQRQASRLLMLHGLSKEDRARMEVAARSQVFEVERFKSFYPEVVDEKLMKTILVEARLRQDKNANDPRAVQNRRDGVLYQ